MLSPHKNHKTYNNTNYSFHDVKMVNFVYIDIYRIYRHIYFQYTFQKVSFFYFWNTVIIQYKLLKLLNNNKRFKLYLIIHIYLMPMNKFKHSFFFYVSHYYKTLEFCISMFKIDGFFCFNSHNFILNSSIFVKNIYPQIQMLIHLSNNVRCLKKWII